MWRIAVLDEDDDVRRLIGEALEERGWSVVLCRRLTDLLVALAAYPLNLVIADPWTGRVEHELEVLRTVRRAAMVQSVPILLCSTAADQVPWDGSTLAKPFDLADLYCTIEEMLHVESRKIG